MFLMTHSRSNEEWLQDRKDTGEAQEKAIADLSLQST
jgi:hypothetical protein